jgi:hypothetical protein
VVLALERDEDVLDLVAQERSSSDRTRSIASSPVTEATANSVPRSPALTRPSVRSSMPIARTRAASRFSGKCTIVTGSIRL